VPITTNTLTIDPKSLPTANPAYLEGLGPQTPAGDNPELKKAMKELAGSFNSANYHTIDPHSLPTQDPASLDSRATATSPRRLLGLPAFYFSRHTRAPNRSRIQVSESIWVQSLGVGGLGGGTGDGGCGCDYDKSSGELHLKRWSGVW
ncbi:hypothetical protein JG688_00009361, partial [Phytophthora aleatoria]